jgi:hypothetical protein
MALAVEGENSDTRASNKARPDLCAAGPCAPSTASLTCISQNSGVLPPQPSVQKVHCQTND